MIKYRKSNEIVNNEESFIICDKVEFKTKIRKINNSLLMTMPQKMIDEFQLDKGNPLFIILEHKDRNIKFITCLSHGSHAFLANIPNYKGYGLIGGEEVNVKVLFNQAIKKLGNNNIIGDITDLDLSKINYFIDKDKIYLLYKSSNTKKGNVINRFFAINSELAYVIGLYDAEGAENSFRFTNSDPKLIQIFLENIEKTFGLKEQDFDAQITRVCKDKESNSKESWSNKFPYLNIYNKISYKNGGGVEFGSLSVLINTLTMSTVWNSLRDKMRKIIVLYKTLSSNYIAGVLDGDGNVYIDKNLGTLISVKITSDSREDSSLIFNCLKNLGVSFKIINYKKSNAKDTIIFGWYNFIKIFNFNSYFRYNIKRRTKFLKGLINHRKSKVILRTLKAIEDKSYSAHSICDAMKIQRKHIRRVYNYLEQLKTLNMIDYDCNNNIYLTEKGINFLNTKYNI